MWKLIFWCQAEVFGTGSVTEELLMDSVTHAVSGATLLLAMPRRPATAWAVPLSMIVASLPDIDVVFHRIPIDSLLLHRGITHALPAAPVFALLYSV